MTVAYVESRAPVAVRERPLLFSAPMVLAILDGRKIQTRRIVKPGRFVLPTGDDKWDYNGAALVRQEFGGTSIYPLPFCPYGVPGDRLWVRETWSPNQGDESPWCEYRADCVDQVAIKWKPGIHMPRRLSRIDLEITDVRVQRLQDISEADARAEGVDPVVFMAGGKPDDPVYRIGYEILWDQINGAGSWDANPWVWALTVKRLRP